MPHNRQSTRAIERRALVSLEVRGARLGSATSGEVGEEVQSDDGIRRMVFDGESSACEG